MQKTIYRVCALLIVSAVLCSCAGVRYRLPTNECDAQGRLNEHWRRVFELKAALSELDPAISSREAGLVAETAVFYSLELANAYELTAPPIFHNTLVNMGIKERGLCIHWVEDLIEKVRAMDLETIEFHWGVTNREAVFRLEHSVVVATARGKPFEQGMVLDPWRNSGRIHFCRVTEDKYVWEKWPY